MVGHCLAQVVPHSIALAGLETDRTDMFEHEAMRFSKKTFEWSEVLVFDSVERAFCQHRRPHVTKVEDAKAALHGRWDEVIVAGVDAPYVNFVTSEGLMRMWAHEPNKIEALRIRVEDGDDVWWSEEAQMIAVTFEELTVMIGLEEGEATECVALEHE